jgi:hypothetical protein
VAWEVPPGNNSVDLKEGKSPNSKNASEPPQPLEANPLPPEASPSLILASLELNASLELSQLPLEAPPELNALVCSAVARGLCPLRHAPVCLAARGPCPP